MADRAILRELINVIGVEVDSKAESTVSSFLGGIEAGVNRAGKFFFLLGELLSGLKAGFDATVGAFFRFVTGVASAADEMRLASERAGVGAQAFQELAYAASTVGADTGSVTAALLELSKGARKVAAGSEEASEKFSKLGVSVRGASGKLKSPDELLRSVADKLAAMPPGAERSAAAFDVLGTQGVRLLPVLSKGSAGLAALAKEGHELGVVLEDEVIAASDEYMSELGRVQAASQGLKNALGGPFLKVLTLVLVELTKIAKVLRPIINSKAKAFVEGLTKAMGKAAKIADALYDALLLLAGLMLGKLLFSLSALTAAQLAWGVAALISGARATAAGVMAAAAAVLPLLPWLALGAAIVLVGEEIASFFTGADSALKRFINYLDTVAGTDLFSAKDNPIVELLKSIGSLIFDITDTKKWSRLFSAIGGYLAMLVDDIKQVAKWIGRVFGETTIEWGGMEIGDGTGKGRKLTSGMERVSVGELASGVSDYASRVASETRITGPSVEFRGAGMASRLGTLSQQPSPMEALFGRGGSPTGAVQSSPTGTQVLAPVFTLTQEVNAAPGQSATEVGRSAAESGQDWFSEQLQRTLAAYPR